MRRQTLARALATLVGAAAGAVLMSGSGQPVTARPYPSWQRLPDPPLSERTHSLGVHARHEVLLLGGLLGGRGPARVALRDGATYDLRTGRWHHLRLPVATTDRDAAVAAGGVVVLQHRGPSTTQQWWRYDVRTRVWSPLAQVPRGLSAPFAFGSEVYALSRGRVVVYSVQLGRWSRLPLDPLRPALRGGRVRAGVFGTQVTGRVAHQGLVTDRWDGVRWARLRHPVVWHPLGSHSATTRVAVGGRTVVFRGDRALIHNS
jgi:hypothetical protein